MVSLFTYSLFVVVFIYVVLLLVLILGVIRAFRPKNSVSEKLKFSVIIPFRNEENVMKNCLTAVANQSYPKELYEVILVDDSSDDNTVDTITELLSENIKLYSSATTGKKAAISLGISKAENEIIVTTDADCTMGEDWLQEIANNFGISDMLVLPVVLEYADSFSTFQALDYLSLQGVTAATIGLKSPTMCSGANLAYRKSVFVEVGGYKGNEKISSGDDVFLLEKFSKSHVVNYYFSPKAVVKTTPAASFKQFISQRVRWGSKMTKVSFSFAKLLGGVVLLVHFSLFITFLVAAIYVELLPIVGLAFAVKLAIDFTFLALVSKAMKQHALLRYFPASAIKNFVYTIIVLFFGKFASVKWKGREIN